MDYTAVHWAEFLVFVPPIMALVGLLGCLITKAEVFASTLILGVLLTLPSMMSLDIYRIGVPNASDDSKCLNYLRNSDPKELEVSITFNKIKVETNGVGITFPEKVRRRSVNYWNNRENQKINVEKQEKQRKIEQHINKTIFGE